MYEANKYDGKKELQDLIKRLPYIPTNTEIIEKTGMSKGSVSEIMRGKRAPTEKFVHSFKNGFKLDTDMKFTEITNPQPNSEGLQSKIIKLLEDKLARVEAELNLMIQENNRLNGK